MEHLSGVAVLDGIDREQSSEVRVLRDRHITSDRGDLVFFVLVAHLFEECDVGVAVDESNPGTAQDFASLVDLAGHPEAEFVNRRVALEDALAGKCRIRCRAAVVLVRVRIESRCLHE